MANISSGLRTAIATIPGTDGWWHSSDRDQFEEIAEGLLECGLDEIQVLETLEAAYSAVANEFGS